MLLSTVTVLALNGTFGGGAGIPEDTMTRGLVLAYNFDEGSGQTAYNAASTGSVNDGTLGSTATADSADPKWINRSQASNSPGSLTSDSSGALSFDGKNDYVNCGNDPSLDITDAITIEAWVKPTSAANFDAIVSKQGINVGYMILMMATKKFRMYVGDGNWEYVESDTIFDGVSWYHITGTYNPSDGKIRIYINGILEGTPTSQGAPLTSAVDVIIGAYASDPTTYYFNGSIDSVRIYNRALSAEEVRYHYNRGGPVAHWKFDEGAGSIVHNSGLAVSDTASHGTIYGATGTADVESAAATLVDATKAWITNEWAGETVEITSGTGNGQTRTVSSNTATVITVSAVWTDNPDATSVYRVTSNNEWTLGKHKTGLSFDGIDDYVDIGDTTETSVKTISFWLKADDITSRDVIDLNGSSYIEIDASSNITATGFTGVVYIDAVVTSTIDTNWHHITITTSSGQNASDLDIGVRDGNAYFDGMIDDVRIYNYVRSADEIRLDYNAGFAVRLGGKITGPSSVNCSTDPGACMDYGLVASYDMDEGDGQTLYNAADTGSANDGTLVNGPKWINRSQTSNSSGSLTSDSSGALEFDGVNDYVNCGNDASLDIADAITIEAWVKPTLLSGKDRIIVGKGITNGYTIWYQYAWDFLLVDIAESDSTRHFVHINGSNNLPLNQYTHLVGIYDGQYIILYVNGVERAKKDVGSYTINTIAQDLLIGKHSTYPFNGSIDSVRIYNRALSAEEVRYHYNRGGPVLQYRFDEGSGQYARDSIGNADAQLGSDTSSSGDIHDPAWSK